MVHWACEKVKQQDLDDEAIADAIVQKLSDHPGISYADIAETAHKIGKPDLATRVRIRLGTRCKVSFTAIS